MATPRDVQRTRAALVAVAVVALVAGAAVGAWVDWTWPNPVYGAPLFALGPAVLLVVLGVIVARRGPIGTAFAVSSVALLVGIVYGMEFLGAPPPSFSQGTMTLRLERPLETSASGTVYCEVVGNRVSAGGDLGSLPIEGEPLVAVYVDHGDGAGAEAGEMRADDRELAIRIEGPVGDPQETREYVATEASLLEGNVDGAGGSLRFDKLFAYPPPPAAPSWIRNLDLGGGTLEWTCPPSP